MSVRQSPHSHRPAHNQADHGELPPVSDAPGPGHGVLELLPPGSFVTLHNHPSDLPPFQVIKCRGGRCLVRQQAWGKHVQWEVEHQHLQSA
ncbi:MAG: hypothetical protein ACON4T_06905 [Synechococcus sp.]